MAEIKIAVLDDYQGVALASADWSRLDAEIEVFSEHLGAASIVAERLAGFDVVVAMRERTPFPRALIEALPDLGLLVTTGMRNAAIDLEAAEANGVMVCGTPSPGHATAELTFALILALSRGLVGEVESVRSGGWQAGLGRDVRGSTLGLIGLGRLGSQVAAFGKAFGMDVVSWSQNLTSERTSEVGVALVDKESLFAGSDFVSVHLKLSDRSTGLVGAEEIGLMKPTAYLVNTSRGPIVDVDALLAAVQSGAIAGAAVDVHDPEPLPSDHPIRSEPRILATPHIGYVTAQTYRIFYEGVVEDIEAWVTGTPIRVLAGGQVM
jgi:phosphoglycerate dehydrogenase-like enzyme